VSPVLERIADAFEWRPGRSSDRTWLDPGFTATLATLSDRYPDTTEAVLWAAALLFVVLARGGTCLPVAHITSSEGYEDLPDELRALSPDQWREQMSGSAFYAGSDVRPLLLEHDRLYFDRYFRLEARVASALSTPLDELAPARPSGWEATCDQIFTGGPSELARRAVSELWSHRTYLLEGGPGTGKTTTLARFLVALAHSTDATPNVRLCAPTGKAAQRMGLAIGAEIKRLEGASGRGLPEAVTPVTIHSLLGITPRRARRDESQLLNIDFLICDEASMVDVGLLAELLDAVPSTCRVILVGDPDQLQSVDVGSVMSDLSELRERGLLAGTRLESTHRIDESVNRADRETLLEFFTAVRGGSERALEQFDGPSGVLEFIELGGPSGTFSDLGVAGELAISRTRRLQQLAHGSDDAALNDELTSVMVLCAQHQGFLGRSWWVENIATLASIPLRAHPRSVGTPILITRSDRASGLTNGDTGVLVERHGEQFFHFNSRESGPRLRPAAITHWQPWWAMTIHKSQGSEFDTVIVSITPNSSLLSRELIYTAVTRARRRVIVLGRRDDLRAAIGRSALRFSGLVEMVGAQHATR
jgi:exodeoxyribonuclease V alpha subunit